MRSFPFPPICPPPRAKFACAPPRRARVPLLPRAAKPPPIARRSNPGRSKAHSCPLAPICEFSGDFVKNPPVLFRQQLRPSVPSANHVDGFSRCQQGAVRVAKHLVGEPHHAAL